MYLNIKNTIFVNNYEKNLFCTKKLQIYNNQKWQSMMFL